MMVLVPGFSDECVKQNDNDGNERKVQNRLTGELVKLKIQGPYLFRFLSQAC